jgi:dolichol-phosphate mannosyltransferase
LWELVSTIEKNVQTITDKYEIVLVDDGSPDNSWSVMTDIARNNPRIKVIKLSRNFGQHYAITSGLDHASGEWVVVMDCDLQDRPEEIKGMLDLAVQEKVKIILGQRIVRNDNIIKKWLSRIFYYMLSYLSGSVWDPTVANFGLYHRNVVDAIGNLREPIRFFPSMVKWVGFSMVKMPVKHSSREEGKSSYSLKKRLKLALDIILANSDKPLRIIVKLGMTISLGSALIGIFYIIKYITGDIQVLGFTSLFISIWFIGGIICSILGVIGLYIGKIFESAKRRPIYLIEEMIN